MIWCTEVRKSDDIFTGLKKSVRCRNKDQNMPNFTGKFVRKFWHKLAEPTRHT